MLTAQPQRAPADSPSPAPPELDEPLAFPARAVQGTVPDRGPRGDQPQQ